MSFAYRRGSRLLVLANTAMALMPAIALPSRDATAQPPTQGSGGGGGGSGGGGRMAALFQGITLSSAQQQTIDSIRTSYQPQMQQLRSQGPGARGQMREMMQKETGAFRAVLTADQQTVFDKNMEAMRSRMGSGGAAPGGAAGPGTSSSGGGGGDAQ
jgi:Spy/CpxP family protein refolding chaperone